METHIMTGIQMNTDRKRHSIAAERLWIYKTVQTLHVTVSTIWNKHTWDSSMSATYSKNIQHSKNVLFYVEEIGIQIQHWAVGRHFQCSWTAQWGFSKGTLYIHVLLIHLEAEGNGKIPIAYTINNKNLISHLALDSLQKTWKGRLLKLKGILRNTDVMHYLS